MMNQHIVLYVGLFLEIAKRISALTITSTKVPGAAKALKALEFFNYLIFMSLYDLLL